MMTQVLRPLAAIRHAGTLVALLCGALLATPLFSARAETQAAQSSAEELARRSAVEQSARNSGDAAQILTSARRLAAFALRLLGDLDLAESHLQSSITHYHQSLTFDNAPETRVKLAVADLAAAKPDAALAEYATLTAAQPEDARAAKLAAQAYLQKDDLGHAADALTRAWKLDSTIDTGVLLITADLRAGRREHANGVAGQILAQTGDGARPHLILAQTFHAAGDLDRTIVELFRVISLEPDSASAHLALGEAFWELNEYQYNADSLHEFTEAQRLNPADFFSNLDLGSILSQYQRYADAMPYLMRAAESDPSSPDPWLDLGMNAYAQNLTGEARPALEKAVALTGSAESRNNFQIRRAYAALSRINSEAHRTTEAQHFADREQQLHAAMLVSSSSSILSESTSVTANFSGNAGARSGSQSETNNPRPSETQAQQDLRHELEDTLASSLNDAGTALARSHDYAGALPYFRQAAAVDPSSALTQRNFGFAAFHAGSYAEAVPALTRVVQTNPADALAQAYLEQARAAQANLSAPAVSGKP